MPLKLNIGLSKKIGLPNYGSLGASCYVEVELDASILQTNLEGFQRQVRTAYATCRQAVNDELAHSGTKDVTNNDEPAPSTSMQHGLPQANDPDKNGPAANGTATHSHPASQKQLDYVHQLAGQITGLGVRRLESLAQNLFEIPLAGLSNAQASRLIVTLKEIKAGKLDLEAALNGAAV